MQSRLPADVRRAQLVQAAIDVAERVGIESLTVRALSEYADVTKGIVQYHFETKQDLVIAMGEHLIVDVTAILHAALDSAVGTRELPGVRGLRELVHGGLSAVWLLIEKSSDRQLLAYEIKTYLLRHRALGSATAAEIANGQYRIRDSEAQVFFEKCSDHTGTRWIEPVESIARFGMATLDGLVLRWLVDGDDLEVLAQIDDLSGLIAGKALDR
ncbi:TetR family transcriptional regulator [Rhodococcus fascians]|nr:TetR family transcriptional regulator [Rhodococcus fascians]